MRYNGFFALFFLAAILLADFATAAVHWDDMRVKHTWITVPANWESLGNATAGAMINFHFALEPEREDALIDALSEVSDPSHPRYGSYLSKEQVAGLVSPHPETLELVRAWLVHHGIRLSSISISHGGSWLTVTNVPVSQANQLLGASYQLYRNSKTNDMIIRTVSYALPSVLHTCIRTVAPTTYFPSTRGMRRTPRKRSFGAAPAPAVSGELLTARQSPDVTPSLLRWLYKTAVYRPSAPIRNRLGILGIDDEYPSQSDLTRFMTRYRYAAGGASYTVVQWNGGGYNPNNAALGPTVGIQYAAVINYPTSLVFYSIGGEEDWDHSGRPTAVDMYLVWLNNLLEEESPPQTISIAHGHFEMSLPFEYARSLCRLFAQLGVRGVTILAASGNDGVGEGNCINDQGLVQFVPEFPSTCPWVTSVGGTHYFRPEMAANLSGGGFSYYNERPWYQHNAVILYLKDFPQYPGFYNREGRGYPDISAQALNYEIIMNGELLYADGTNCAVSTAAGIISLVNDHLISRGRSPLGFFNPWLYSYGLNYKALKDVKFGGNPGCGDVGFLATSGWDPATGLGTLDFEKLLETLDEWPIG